MNNLPPIQAKHYRVQVLTEHYEFAGALEPFGLLMIYLNDPEHSTIILKNAQAVTLDMETVSQLDTFQSEELLMHRDEIIAINLLDPVTPGTIKLMPRRERLRVFLPRFILQATFSCGAEARLGDFFDSTAGFWAAALDAAVRPILPTKHPTFTESKTILINKQHIRFYQLVKEQGAG